MILLNLSELIHNPIEFLKQLACMLPVMLLSLTLHEWGHAFAAYKCGDPTARNLGRMTMNPLAHIDPYGFLMILFVGFGWAKPVPVNSRNYRNYKQGEAIVSLAGVFMNLMLVVCFSVLFVLFGCLLEKYSDTWIASYYLWLVLRYGIILNITLILFNMLPIYPLDGYHIFELLFARRLPMNVFLFLRRYGQYILIGVLILMRVLHFYPAYDLAVLLMSALERLVFAIVF